MHIIKILFSFFIFFISVFAGDINTGVQENITKETNIQESILEEIESTKNILMNIDRGEIYINKIDSIIENIKGNQIKLRVTNNKLNVILSKIKNIFDENADNVRIIIKYFQGKIKKELPEEIEEVLYEKHLETPEVIKSVYYTSYSGGSKSKIDTLISLVKNTEINSVTIDIKEVDGYVAFDMSDYEFGNIKPVSNNRISDIKNLTKLLHENNIYVIGRIVVFKDQLLAETNPGLGIKWVGKNEVWSDYKGNKYLDAYAKDVWDYTVNISRAAYDLGFDEINYDYIRFPSDGVISEAYYPYANTVISKNPKWGKIMVIDGFSNYITSELKGEFPDIKLSADIFGLVTNSDLFNIGQNLESFLLYFDYVGPMIYPSHYSINTLTFSVPDNYPYEIIKDALSNTNRRIDELNIEIQNAKNEERKVSVKDAFYPKKDISNQSTIPKTIIRPWLQGFSCTRCDGATPYTRTKFRKQIGAIVDSGLNSWWVWNSASNYYIDWYNKM